VNWQETQLITQGHHVTLQVVVLQSHNPLGSHVYDTLHGFSMKLLKAYQFSAEEHL
jgi:hypothetical protein